MLEYRNPTWFLCINTHKAPRLYNLRSFSNSKYDWLLAGMCRQVANHCALFLSLRMNSSFITSAPGPEGDVKNKD